jgi:hypothetical protein
MSPPGDAIGTLFSAHMIEEAVLSALVRWLPLYVDEVKNQYGLSEFPDIESWGLVDEDDEKWPEQAYPALVVIAEEPEQVEEYAEGWYRASWPFKVSVHVEHPQRVWARKIAQIYSAAIRGALLQRKSLGDAGRDVKWTGGSLPWKAFDRSRTLAIGFNNFIVTQDEVVNWQAGPKDELPPAELPSEGPEVSETEVQVDVEVE